MKKIKKVKTKMNKELEFKPESSRKFIRENKKKIVLSSNKEFEMMLKSIMINNPGLGSGIIDAFRVIDRKFFVSDKRAYEDRPLHIAHGQTISQPTTIARMLALLHLEQGLDVLEIGANTGYHACLVAWLVFPGSVTSIEIFCDLVEKANKNIKKFIEHLKTRDISQRLSRIKIIAGDGLDYNNDIWKKKYDRIYYTAGIEISQVGLVKDLAQRALKEEGLLLFPTRESFDWGGLEIWQKKNNKLILIKRDEGYTFVPLIRQKDIEELYRRFGK